MVIHMDLLHSNFQPFQLVRLGHSYALYSYMVIFGLPCPLFKFSGIQLSIVLSPYRITNIFANAQKSFKKILLYFPHICNSQTIIHIFFSNSIPVIHSMICNHKKRNKRGAEYSDADTEYSQCTTT